MVKRILKIALAAIAAVLLMGICAGTDDIQYNYPMRQKYQITPTH